jgi:general L-amino acid transport system permease protein
VFSTVLGFFIAIARLSSNPLLSSLARAYVEGVRNIPLLLQLFFWYFAVLGSLPLPRQSLTFLDVVFLNKRGLSIPAPVAEPSLPTVSIIAVIALAAALLLFRQARRFRIRTGRTSRPLWITGAVCCSAPVAAALVLGNPVSWDVPRLTGFNLSGGLSMIPEFVAMAVGMSVYGSAFVAEIVRGGISTVGRGQTEAALALGLTRGRIYSKIIIPQALRAIVPPLSAQYISLVKTSSLAAAIGYPDLMLIFAGTALNQTGQPLQIMAMTMGSYLLLCLVTAAICNLVNRRIQLVER